MYVIIEIKNPKHLANKSYYICQMFFCHTACIISATNVYVDKELLMKYYFKVKHQLQ